MNLKKVGMVAGTVLVAGGLLAGAAFAAGGAGRTASTEKQHRVEAKKQLSPGQAELVKQLTELRKSYFEKMKAESKALIEQAVKDGKITQAEADQLLKHGMKHGKPGHLHHKGARKPTLEQVKAKLDAAVQSGRLTREQADRMLQRWQEKHSQSN